MWMGFIVEKVGEASPIASVEGVGWSHAPLPGFVPVEAGSKPASASHLLPSSLYWYH